MMVLTREHKIIKWLITNLDWRIGPAELEIIRVGIGYRAKLLHIIILMLFIKVQHLRGSPTQFGLTPDTKDI